ncbi:MAG TPA: DNRLRE domain-containing protein [Candidatus Krumholzibacteria bacterium]|nr:DNRLRE domain-containing protein [Candidatus Krumholzibacteria bacterium]
MKRFLRIIMGLFLMVALLPTDGRAVAVNIPASQDNTLYENATGAVSNGAGDYFFTGRTREGFKRRAVIKFDIASNIPAGATITSVTLHLYMSRSKETTLYSTSIYPVTASWGEGTSNADAEEGQGIASTTNDATWIHRFYPGTLWTTAGGDHAPQASATTPVGNDGFYAWSSVIMLADVQGWLDTPSQNFGWLMIGDESTTRSSKRFDSRTSSIASQRPQLTVEFTPAGTVTGACCLPAGSGCTILSAADCALQGGTYQGDLTTCTPSPCGYELATLSPVKDNTMYASSGTLSNGAGEYLFVGRVNASGVKRSLLQFDIASAVPANATLTSVKLQLEASLISGSTTNVNVHKVLAQWGEGTSDATGDESTGAAATTNDATWTHRLYPATTWTTAGGQYNATASATTAVTGTGTYQWTSATLMSDAQAWLNSPSSNFGWVLIGVESGNTQKRFDSRQFIANAAQRPKLIVTYTLPAPSGACCLPAGVCNVLTQAQCVAAGGIYQGDNAPCVTDLCPLALTPFVDALPIPPLATPISGSIGGTAEYNIAIQQVTQKLHRDLPLTTVWGYNGMYPGPTIVASVDQAVTVNWINDLRENGVLRTTHYLPVDLCIHGPDTEGNKPRIVTHLHGGHVETASDGYPTNTILPGQQQTTHYPNHQVAGTLWYHDHALGITRLNVMMGLAGFYLLFDPAQAGLNLPSGEYEIGLAIQDRAFHNDGSLKYPEMWMDHFYGDVILVNGKVWPYLNVKQGKYRFRMLEGSNTRSYVLTLSNGAPFTVIGDEGGLLPAPVVKNSLTMTPGERFDVVIDFASYPAGTEIILQNSAAAGWPANSGPSDIPNVMKFVVVGQPGHTTPIPATLVAVPPIPEAQAVEHRDLVLSKMAGDCTSSMWMINGKHFGDPIDEFPKLGTTEVWRFINNSGVVHPMHMHLTMFQILDRQDFVMVGDSVVTVGDPIPPEPWEAGWKDTAPVYPDQVLRVICKFEDYTGKYPYHCHVLEHEENDMMREFEVVQGATAVTPEPPKLALRQSYPNPSNPAARIEFSTPVAARVNLKLYDVHGRLIATLFDSHARAGQYVVNWDGRSNKGERVPSGIYFYRLNVPGQPVLTRKLVLLK